MVAGRLLNQADRKFLTMKNLMLAALTIIAVAAVASNFVNPRNSANVSATEDGKCTSRSLMMMPFGQCPPPAAAQSAVIKKAAVVTTSSTAKATKGDCTTCPKPTR